MRIKRLEAEGIFSFGIGSDRFALDFDDGLTVIVGPNASGKSNVSRVLNLVQAAVRLDRSSQEERTLLNSFLDDHVRSAVHDGVPPGGEISVRLDVVLGSEADVALMTAFMQAMVLRGLLGNMSADQSALSSLEAWVFQQVTPDHISDLFEGTIVISNSRVPGTLWNIGYEFHHRETPLTWHIHSSLPNLSNTIAPRTWSAEDGLPFRESLFKRLTGNDQPSNNQLVPPDIPFSLDTLLPRQNAATVSQLSQTTRSLVAVEMESVNANVAPAPHRAFAEAYGPFVGEPLDLVRRSHNLSSVLSPTLDRGLRFLGAEGSSPRQLVSTLHSHLHALKNGTQADQVRYRTIQSLFEELAPGHRFELRFEWSQPADTAPEPNYEIEIFPSDSTMESSAKARPLRYAGTGVEQALILSEMLVADPDRVLVLDEPATNLHPSWQRIVRRHLCSQKSQCILVTHSPYLIPSESTEHLSSIVRFSRRNGASQIHRMGEMDLADDRWVNSLIRELAWSADARGLLFANGVVLTEGETELAALPIWFAKSKTASRSGGPDDLDIAFLSVGGDTAFGTFLFYLERFGVPWTIVCDGAAFRFDTAKHIFEQVLDSGTDDPQLNEFVQLNDLRTKEQSDMDRELFQSMVSTARERGIFTLASGWTRGIEGDLESFEAFVRSKGELQDAFDSALAVGGRSKPRVGRLLADPTACPREIDDLYNGILDRLWAKGMPR